MHYDEQFKAQKLEIIVMPHSHHDPGWKETLDEWYTRAPMGWVHMGVPWPPPPREYLDDADCLVVCCF